MRIVEQSAELEALTFPVEWDDVSGEYWPSPCLDSSSGATLIEKAARTCYRTEGKIGAGSARALVAKLKSRHHDAMLEFCDATFRCVTDRGVTHEMVRHRLCSYAQESTRYCDYHGDRFGGEISVIEPPGLDPQARVSWERAVMWTETAYLEMTRGNVSAQIARSVLPTCLRAEIVWKANFREWLHIIALRESPAAHPQMQALAKLIHHELVLACPEVFS